MNPCLRSNSSDLNLHLIIWRVWAECIYRYATFEVV